ncbi:MAG TPA: hypothetical protein GX527_06935, partial [Clostridiaceae bacterium]|nr:hypothetical protein [Clostridiaceae bacterium]
MNSHRNVSENKNNSIYEGKSVNARYNREGNLAEKLKGGVIMDVTTP